MATKTTGARASAVTKRHLSIGLLSLDPAAATRAGREGRDRPPKLLWGEVRPERVRDVELCVGDLPEEEVRDSELPAGADHEIHLRDLRSVEVGGEGGLVDLFGREPVFHHAPGGVHELRPASVVERDVDVEALVCTAELFGVLDRHL